MSYGIQRAIERGYDSACSFRKDGPEPYHMKHPLFPYWWTAVVTKADCRDFSLKQVRQQVLRTVKWRGRE